MKETIMRMLGMARPHDSGASVSEMSDKVQASAHRLSVATNNYSSRSLDAAADHIAKVSTEVIRRQREMMRRD